MCNSQLMRNAGGEVANTIAGGIANPSEFQGAPEVLMYGMLCALVAAGTWVTLATYLELPVSTTHSISEWSRRLWRLRRLVGAARVHRAQHQ